MSEKTVLQKLDEQTRRLRALHERRTRLEVYLENQTTALKEAEAQAMSEFGTADLDALREKYAKTQAENNRAVAELTAELDGAELALEELEKSTSAVPA
jgi:multidrug resistance efflux pump